MTDHNATDAVSRRNVLKTAGGLLAGSTMLAGLGAGPAAAETEEGLQMEIREANKVETGGYEYIAVRVSMSEELYERVNERGAFPERVFLGLADQFVIREDRVSLPEETEGLARPVEMDFENPHDMTMYFRMQDTKVADFIGQNYIEMGLGIFTERTIPANRFDEVIYRVGRDLFRLTASIPTSYSSVSSVSSVHDQSS